MTATLLVIVPVALLALVGAFYFVGCTLDTQGLGLGFTQYSDLDIIPNPDCVAYWQLADSPGQTLALDVVGKAHGDPHHGTYVNVANATGLDTQLFPIPDFNPSPTNHSPGAPGTQTIGAPGIVTGDTLPPHDKNNPTSTTCMQTNGGFVTIDANAACNPQAFTIECWVKPEWSDSDAPAARHIIDSTDFNANGGLGFALVANGDGKWSALMGGSITGFVEVVASKVALDSATHLVLTFDGTEFAALFVNGDRIGVPTQVLNYVPNTARPIVIGVGGPFLNHRTTGAMEPPPLFPFLPFKGKIQNVAIYKAVLPDATIKDHSEHGQGKAGSEVEG